MHVSIKNTDATTRQLMVELDQKDLQKHIERAERALAGAVQIDGFRPGKAPREKVRQQVGDQAIRQEALSGAVESSLDEIITQHKFDVRVASNLRITDNNAQRLVYQVTLALYPEIVLPDLATIKITRRPVAIEDAEVAQALETLRTYRAKFLPKDGPAATGDRVEVDFVVRQDGKIVSGGESKNHPLIIGGKSFLPGFEDQLVGMTVGQEKDFTVQAPGDYFQKEIAGKELTIHVKVGMVQTVQTPALDDAFAKSAGKFATLEQLRSSVRDGLLQEKNDKEKERVRLAALDALIEKTPITIPTAMLNEQLDFLMASFEQQLQERGMELEMYLGHISKTRDQLREQWHDDAQRQAKIQLLIHKIGQANGIVVTNEEIEQQVAVVVQTIVLRQNISPDQLDLARIQQQVRQQALNDKILGFIEERCAV